MVSGSLRLPLEDPATWNHLHGRQVIMGIRAEGVQIASSAELHSTLAKVRLVEHAGAEQVFFAEAGSTEFCGRVSADAGLIAGDVIQLRMLQHELFLFDAATGLALVQSGKPVENAL